jgi:SM-20-related protein
MAYLDLAAIAAAPVHQDPFEHMLVDQALFAESAPAIEADYPKIDKPGSFALGDLEIGPAVRQLIAELDTEAFRQVMAEKFAVDLTDRPTTYTLRGACAAKDGQIHTDSKSKIITILIYLNPAWAPDGGRLRLLRNGRDLENYAAELEPTFGRMLAFLRSDRSWHGHKPYEGPRRVLQMNYVTSGKASLLSNVRHRLSALTK